MARLHRKLAEPSPELTIGLSEYALGFETLGIRSDSLMALLEPDNASAEAAMHAAVDAVLADAAARVQVRAGFRVLAESSVLLNGTGVRLDGVRLALGDVVGPSLEGACSVALFAATTGAGFDPWTREAASLPAPYGEVLAALGRRIAQRASDWAQHRIEEVARVAGYRTTSRYYPGSCGWNFSERAKLFQLMPPRFCGIDMYTDGTTVPRHSVLGLIGIGQHVQKRPYPCEHCTLKDCLKLNGWSV
jgi:hypothetical protein